MSDGWRHAATSAVTRDETRFDQGAPGVTRDEFDEGALTFDTHGSSASAKRWHSTLRALVPPRCCIGRHA